VVVIMRMTPIFVSLTVAVVSVTLADAAPLSAQAGHVAGSAVVSPAHYVYTRVCSYGPRGWFLRNHRNQIIACRPHRPNGFGWTWREDGGRSGWYDSQDRRWR
jgi:hypothetical protein